MDLQSIATESQTLRSTIRDLRSVIATDKERLERHEGELTAALDRVCRHESGISYEQDGSARCVDCATALDVAELPSPFGEPTQVAAE